MKIAIEVLAVCLYGASSFGQMSIDEAMARLRARQAHNSTTQPQTQPTNLSGLLSGIVVQANEVYRVTTDGLSTVQEEAVEEQKQKVIERLQDSAVEKVVTCTIIVIDVQKDTGELIVIGQLPLPVPDEIQREHRLEIQSITERYANEIVRWKKNLSDPKTREAPGGNGYKTYAELGKATIEDLTRRQRDEIVATRQRQQIPMATIRLRDNPDAFHLLPGQQKTLKAVKIETVTLGKWNRTHEGVTDFQYVGDAKINARVIQP